MGIYNVQCRNVTIATLVKSSFASLVKSDSPPDYLGDVSISYSHSLGTRVRISLMRSISKRQREKDPKAICTVTSFTARPMMRFVFQKLLSSNFKQFHTCLAVQPISLFNVLFQSFCLCVGFYLIHVIFLFQSWDQGVRNTFSDLRRRRFGISSSFAAIRSRQGHEFVYWNEG